MVKRLRSSMAGVAVLLLVMLSLPGPVAADTCACDPIQPFLVVDRFNEVHTVYRHATSPGIIYASNRTGSWIRKRLTSARDEPYAIAVDADQRTFTVFRREASGVVRFHLITNRSGSWVTSRLSIVPGDAYGVRIAVAPNGTLHVVFGTDEAAWYATNSGGTWTRRRLDRAMGNWAALHLDPQGKVHLLFNQCTNDGVGTCEGAGIYYQTNVTGSWVTTRVTNDQEDWSQDLLVDAGGRVHLVYVREYGSQAQPDLPLGTFYVTNASGTWRQTRVAGSGRMASIERTRSGVVEIVFTRVDEGRGIYRATNATGTWVRSALVSEYALYPSVGMDTNGRLHVAFMRMAIDPGVYYLTNRSGSWSRLELMD